MWLSCHPLITLLRTQVFEFHRKTWRTSSSGYSVRSEAAAVVFCLFFSQVVTDDALGTMGTIKCHHQIGYRSSVAAVSGPTFCLMIARWAHTCIHPTFSVWMTHFSHHFCYHRCVWIRQGCRQWTEGPLAHIKCKKQRKQEISMSQIWVRNDVLHQDVTFEERNTSRLANGG